MGYSESAQFAEYRKAKGYQISDISGPGGFDYQKGVVDYAKWQQETDKQHTTGDLSKLPAAPDLTDQALAKKRTTATMLAGAGMGRRSTFLASQMGEPLLGSKTTLGGF